MRGLFFLFASAGLALAACDAATAPPREVRDGPVAAADFPELSGRVVDSASLLSPAQEGRLADLSASLEAQTSDQLVIVTIPSLQQRRIEDYSLALARNWGIGQPGKDNGVLLLLAPNERLVRIEVGHGLEPILTNAKAKQIIDSALLPMFREARWFEGIETGTQSIVRVLEEAADVPRTGRS